MINLLPPSYGEKIRFGRINARLSKWLIAAVFAIAGLVLIIAFGLFYIDRQTKELQSGIDNLKKQLLTQNLNQVQKDADEISANIKTINQVLSQEIRFSALIQDIGKIMPSGTILGSLTLSKVSGAIDLSANSKDHASAAQIAVNLSDPKNMLFDKVDIVSINCPPSGTNSEYKCAASLRVLFSKNAQNKYLGVAKDSKP